MQKRTISHRLQISFSTFILIVFLGYSLLSSVLSFTSNFTNFTDSLMDNTLFYTSRIINQAIENFDSFIYEYKLMLISLSKNASLIKLITEKDALTMEERLYLERQCKVYLDTIMDIKTETAGVLIVGSNGYLHTDVSRQMLNTRYDFTGTDWFADTMAFDREDILDISAIYVDFYQRNSSLYGKTYTTLSYPIRDYNNHKIGVIYCFLETSELGQHLYLESYNEFEGVFLINSDHRIVLHSDSAMLNTFLTGEVVEEGAERTSFSVQQFRKGQPMWLKKQASNVLTDAVCQYSISGLAAKIEQFEKASFINLARSMGFIIVFCLLLVHLFRRQSGQMMEDLSRKCVAMDPTPSRNYLISELNQISSQLDGLISDTIELNEHNYQLQVSTKLAELNMLVSQMNPHFLFNSLQLLQTEIVCGTKENAEEMLVSLSRLLRYSIDQQQLSVTLASELDFLKNYLKVFLPSWKCQLHFEVYCPDHLMNVMVPKFLLQPLVENSLRHGFGDDVKEAGITVIGSESDDSIYISIIDNGHGIPPEQLDAIREKLTHSESESSHSSSIGIYNIHNRIHLMYGKQYGLSVESAEGRYTRVNILLPRKEVPHESTDH